MPPASIKRIVSRDMKSIKESNLSENGIFIEFNEMDVTEAYGLIIGPKDTCYENGLLYFKINFPANYPYSPPKVLYLSRGSIRIHPNLYTGRSNEDYLGKVCLSLLNTWSGPQWTTIMDITSIFLSIQSLLTDDPIKLEPGYGNSSGPVNTKYKHCVEYETFRTLINKNAFKPPTGYECFQDVVKEHLKNNHEQIIDKYTSITNIKDSDNVHITVSVYSISIVIRYEQLLKYFNDNYLKI